VHPHPRRLVGLHGEPEQRQEGQLQVVQLKEGEAKPRRVIGIRIDIVIGKLARDDNSGGEESIEGPAVDHISVDALESVEIDESEGESLGAIGEVLGEAADAPLKGLVDATAQELPRQRMNSGPGTIRRHRLQGLLLEVRKNPADGQPKLLALRPVLG